MLLHRVAQIGGHTVYKIMDTCMVPIPNETVRSKHRHPSESKLVATQNLRTKIFLCKQNDLFSNAFVTFIQSKKQREILSKFKMYLISLL